MCLVSCDNDVIKKAHALWIPDTENKYCIQKFRKVKIRERDSRKRYGENRTTILVN